MTKYMLYCEICNWKKITDGMEGFTEIKTSPIPGGSPQTKKTEISKSIPQPKKIKCGGCGRGIRPRKIDDPQSKIIEENNNKKRETTRKEYFEKAELLEKERKSKKDEEDWFNRN